MNVENCLEKILPKNYFKRFCDKGKVCCKSEFSEIAKGTGDPIPTIFEEDTAKYLSACEDIECRIFKTSVNTSDLKSKIDIPGIGILSLKYTTEDDGIHTYLYDSDSNDYVTASFTFSKTSFFGAIHASNGEVKRIFRNVSTLIDVPNSVKNVRDDNFDSDDDPIVDTFFELSEEQTS